MNRLSDRLPHPRRLTMDEEITPTAMKNYEGAWVVSAVVGGVLRRIRYYNFTKRQAVRAFLVEVKS